MKLLPIEQAVSNAKTYLIPSYKEFPNTSLHDLPLIIYRPFDMQDENQSGSNGGTGIDPDDVEKLLEKNGVKPAWRYGMFPFNHYHSNTHEILVPYKGTAELCFGHDENPNHIKHNARPGDVYILPAGMTHRSLTQSSDFQMVGSYPYGSHDWDNCRGNDDKDEREKEKLWESVRMLGKKENWLLKMDPIFGNSEGSPLNVFWK